MTGSFLRLAFFFLLASSLSAQGAGVARETFLVAGRPAVLYAAPQPAAGQPWVWFAPTLKGGLSLAGHRRYFDAFMEAGISLAGYDLGEVRGAPGSSAQFTRFYEAMVARGFSPKPILLGQSRGGLMTLAWAVRHPDKVKAWVGIYPVCNLASWPLKNSKAATLADFALSEAELTARLREFNPIDQLAGLAAQQVPMFAVHGDNDVVVPYEENTQLLKERYEAAGGAFTVKVVPDEGHKVGPAFFECEELLAFIQRIK